MDPCAAIVCDDGLVCNGIETCEAGVCTAGTPPDCSSGSDELTCTPGLCEEPTGCVDAPLDPELCECTEPPQPDYADSVDREIDNLSITCPVVGGSAAAGLAVKGSVKVKVPTCHNSCDSEASASVDLSVTATLCSDSKTPIDVTLTGSASHTENGCPPECKDGSCELTCGGGSCVTKKYTGSAAPSISRRLGFGMKPKRLFGSIWSVNCAAQVKGTVTLAGNLTETADEGACNDCKQCDTVGFTSTITAGASATCRVRGGIFGRRFDLALQDLGTIEASISGDNQGSTGACGDTYCGSTLATIKGGVQIPISIPGARWWGIIPKLTYTCRGSVSGCAENNSCGTCSRCDGCADVKRSFDCTLGTS